MTLEEIGRDYLRQSRELLREAAKIKLRMHKAQGGELCCLRTQHEKLTEIARELRITGESLVHYYDKDK